MKELSLFVLDIANNSLAAGADSIDISVEEDTRRDSLIIKISDNGRGMTEQQQADALSPFYTTRTTRKVGFGIPFLYMAAKQTGGKLEIISKPGSGTMVISEFVRSHIDCLPLGDMAATITLLIRSNPDLDFCYRRLLDSRWFELNTRELKKVLDGVPVDNPEVSGWIEGYVKENEALITGE